MALGSCQSTPQNYLQGASISFKLDTSAGVALSGGKGWRYPLSFTLDNESEVLVDIERFAFEVEGADVPGGTFLAEVTDSKQIESLFRKTIIMSEESPSYSVYVDLPFKAGGQKATLTLDLRYSVDDGTETKPLSAEGTL